ncbi:putative 2-succinyl-5-enolpyruvyl-6-hydroxy-3-cyclohexene-1-carboxylic-acid synthase [Gleimia coleocanis DSM 15436]|uniref:Putative 2-succinyl-5-enolpyruvyl-6-hydroxy-3-cyclohexene-1-carboxylic-acid synthase n=1 Tax=Gleimia coleocanis DSM 15436 TaxID=525245 RepID=C0W0S3_9ACTO|nr:putative 2-succinyl-5-enolpyruvyl-6-hydroxy-3-cyclohexene-1-carboxylic-acid synthase [Gleimia coleocanis DSM 15436]
MAELEAAQLGDTQVHTRIDERSAAFFALGLAKASGRPVAIFMTSGTAVGHCLPAVMEAHHSNTPLVVVSADRPWEMLETGASQTTRQAGIFGSFVRRFVDVPAQITDIRHLINQVQHLQYWWSGVTKPGPVHVNMAFTGSLTPHSERTATTGELVASLCQQGVEFVADRQMRTSTFVVDALRTVVVVGNGEPDYLVQTLAQAEGYVVLAEPGTSVWNQGYALPFEQQLVTLLGAEVERVIVYGRPTLSRPLTQLINDGEKVQWVVSERADYPQLSGCVQRVFTSLPVLPQLDACVHEWALKWHETAVKLSESYGRLSLADGVKATQLLVQAETTEVVVSGASNPVRYLDLIGDTGSRGMQVFTNRGQAGIDGTIAFARGVQAVVGKRVRVLLGDVTFLHDASSLLCAAGQDTPDLDIVLLDDCGGRIFQSLEHGADASVEVYERFFAMGQNVDYRALAQAYGWQYQCFTGLQTGDSQSEFVAALEADVTGGRILHVVCDHADIREAIRDLFQNPFSENFQKTLRVD